MIVPELLQYDFNANELTKTVEELLTNNQSIEEMKIRLLKLKHLLSAEQADCTIAQLVTMELFPKDSKLITATS